MSAITDTKYIYAVGRRKRSVARAKYYAISNEVVEILVNKKPLNEYFDEYYAKTLDIAVKNMGIASGVVHFFINGGGISGQSEAARLALAKVIVLCDPTKKAEIRAMGYITTDTRKVLPKRPGLRKARKREQWSKR